MLDIRIVTEGRAFTLDQALARLGEPRALREIGDLIETMIAKLDDFAGDPDLEDADPSGDPLDMHGEHPTDDGRDFAPIPPIYAVDQTRGPTNTAAGYRAWLRSFERPAAINRRT